MLRIYTHEDCLEHLVPEHHPERPARLAFLIEHLERTGFTKDYPLQVAPQIGKVLMGHAHDATLIHQLTERIPEAGLTPIDPATWISPKSLIAAR